MNDATWLQAKKTNEEEFSDFEDDDVLQQEVTEVKEKKSERKLQPFSSSKIAITHKSFFSELREFSCEILASIAQRKTYFDYYKLLEKLRKFIFL